MPDTELSPLGEQIAAVEALLAAVIGAPERRLDQRIGEITLRDEPGLIAELHRFA